MKLLSIFFVPRYWPKIEKKPEFQFQWQQFFVGATRETLPIYSLHLITLLVLLFAVAHIVFIYCTMWWTLLRDIHRLCLLYWQLGGCVCKGVSIDHHKRDPSTHKKISTAPRRIDIHWIHWTKTHTHTQKRERKHSRNNGVNLLKTPFTTNYW